MFNKLKLPIIGGNKKQRESADSNDVLAFIAAINKAQLEHQLVVFPYIEQQFNDPERPSVITKRALLGFRRATPEELKHLTETLANPGAPE